MQQANDTPECAALAAYVNKGSLHLAADNLAKMREMFGYADADDWDTWATYAHEDVVVFEPECLPYGGEYKGIEGIKNMAKAMFESWRHVTYNVREFCAGGNHVVVLIDVTFTAHGTGRHITMPCTEVWRFQDGKVVELRLHYFDSKLAMDICSGG